MIAVKSSNPAFRGSILKGNSSSLTHENQMSLTGAINKTSILLGLLLISGGFTFSMFYNTTPETLSPILMPVIAISGIGAFVVALITIFKPTTSPITAPIYATLEGAFLGVLTCFIDMMYPGIATQAIMITFSILFSMLFLYRSGYIKVTEKFKAGLFAAIMGIFLVYMTSWILSWFNIYIGAVYGGGLFAIGFSLFVCVIASLFLVLDFYQIDEAVKHGAPKYMEWYCAFSLMLTLVWIYVEVLRLLAILRGRN
jgi:uncharacterized YccA/Bax inhibitor family protein